mmetsp:Transcript_11849/g.22613  ORF Transcript_11849/g.22613 Transcript_11849/m.22613 type:complete len:397 (-) Transcript_11849:144-1334(-)
MNAGDTDVDDRMATAETKGMYKVKHVWVVQPWAVRVSAGIAGIALFLLLDNLDNAAPSAPAQPIVTTPVLDTLASAMYYKVDDEIETVWQAPRRAPKAILFVAHGCNHQAQDFWDAGNGCPSCKGLVEEKRIVRAALERDLAVVAVSSEDRRSGCWRNKDAPRVARALEWVKKHKGWAHLPLFALGASSGGSFVGNLPKDVEIDGLTIQIMGLRETAFRPPFKGNLHKSKQYPPTIFIHMPRDSYTALVVEENVRHLRRMGIPAVALEARPVPVSPNFFSDRIPWVSPAALRIAVEALRREKFLDPEYLLFNDPRQSDWRTVLQGLELVEGDNLGPDESNIAEILNVAWASHEITSDFMNETLDFLEARGEPDILEQLQPHGAGHQLAMRLRDEKF